MSGFDVFLKSFSCCKLDETEIRGLKSAYNAGIKHSADIAKQWMLNQGSIAVGWCRDELCLQRVREGTMKGEDMNILITETKSGATYTLKRDTFREPKKQIDMTFNKLMDDILGGKWEHNVC